MGKGRGRRAGGEAGGGVSRASLYDEVTARIVAELEAGRFPWVQPWDAAVAAPGLPRNAVSNRAYSGINVLILWGEVIARGYASQGWLTFKQALEAGGCVRRGEHGVGVVYADRFIPKEADKGTLRGSVTPPNGDEPPEKAIHFLKRFTLFNVAQCDGLPERMVAGAAPLPERELVPVAEALITATGADFRIGGAEAYYSPSHDYVRVPPQPAFRHQIDYYRTAQHELGHWTGHPSRLARDLSNPFGSAGYAREELVAELASAFLCAALGIVPSVRHANYLGSWLAVLRADNRAIFRAASLATKAADWLLACREPSAMEDAA
ncbi:zincin-like metallopeptidase domain-containing protein [Sphingomonas sp. QA11]|uniref:ArdC family protein n=1 Tax=Sphingomonas sp. QA11 TaxID=2950605 RepID=UPI002348F1D3|nr:zincin-like metallopeptidase domain-containing protein [Sphingomonas sp. QA11]WCM26309.1 zincin-like metallopeptidase domain-containing protein [Sphingomonas sp. QA11]